MTVTPRFFVSAVSSDLRAARKLVNQALTQSGCLPIEESLAGTEYGRIRELQERWSNPCQAVIHVVGRDYGGEPNPDTLPAGQPRRSWTQMEYDYAVQRNKKLYVIVCRGVFPYETSTTEDFPEQAELQARHREAVLAGEHLRHQVGTEEELRSAIQRMKLPLDEL